MIEALVSLSSLTKVRRKTADFILTPRCDFGEKVACLIEVFKLNVIDLGLRADPGLLRSHIITHSQIRSTNSSTTTRTVHLCSSKNSWTASEISWSTSSESTRNHCTLVCSHVYKSSPVNERVHNAYHPMNTKNTIQNRLNRFFNRSGHQKRLYKQKTGKRNKPCHKRQELGPTGFEPATIGYLPRSDDLSRSHLIIARSADRGNTSQAEGLCPQEVGGAANCRSSWAHRF